MWDEPFDPSLIGKVDMVIWRGQSILNKQEVCHMSKSTKRICLTALGIALYCSLSLSMKIPLGVGHIAVDLGYIVLAVYAYYLDGISAAVVGGCSAAIMSLLTGWFSLEWVLANIAIGFICGGFYNRTGSAKSVLQNICLTVAAVGLGMLVIKTVVSCWMWNIPVLVKLPKSVTAWVVDSIVMSIGVLLAPKLPLKAQDQQLPTIIAV